MTKKEFVEICEQSYYGSQHAIVLFLGMPSGEEIIINTNIPEKINYVLDAYDDDMRHKHNSEICINQVRFIYKEKILNYLSL